VQSILEKERWGKGWKERFFGYLQNGCSPDRYSVDISRNRVVVHSCNNVNSTGHWHLPALVGGACFSEASNVLTRVAGLFQHHLQDCGSSLMKVYDHANYTKVMLCQKNKKTSYALGHSDGKRIAAESEGKTK